MAIPKLYSILKRQWPDITENVRHTLCDSLYLDMNSIFHQCLTKSRSKDEFFKSVVKYIDELQTCIVPKTTLFLAFDGVPPMAKIKDQAQRRYAYSKLKPNCFLDANALTPGTELMKELSVCVQSYASTTLKSTNSKLEVIVSDSSSPGEGEHKIIDHIRGVVKDADQQDIVIYGTDADLILLGLSLSKSNVRLVRDTSWRKAMDDNTEFEALAISKLKNNLLLSYPQKTIDNIGSHQIGLDIVLLFAMCGNDFMPAPGEFELESLSVRNLLDKLKDYHQKFATSIVRDNGQIRNSSFSNFLSMLEDLDFENFKKYNKINKKALEVKILELQLSGLSLKERKGLITDTVRTTELEAFKKWRLKKYSKQIELNEKARFFEAYMKGLQWLLIYYLEACPSWNWVYEYPIAPHFSDMAMGLKGCDAEFDKGEPLSPVHQLALVLPRKSQKLLPDKYRDSERYEEFSSLLRDPTNCSSSRITEMLKYFTNELDQSPLDDT